MRVKVLIVALPLAFAAAGPALAISDEECDRRFDAARTTQSLNGMDRATYGKTQCADPSGNTLPGATQTNGASASDTQAQGTVAKDPAAPGSPTTPQENKPKVVVPSK